jgi:acetoin utilization protein AcuB
MPIPQTTKARTRTKPEPHRLVAADLMTENPRTIGVNDSLEDAIEALQTMHVRHLPVVDAEGDLVGMLSDRDVGALLRPFRDAEQEEGAPPGGAGVRVASLMSGDVVCVDADADVREIIERMLEEKIGAVPVVDGEGTVVGIVSYVDILRAALTAEWR